jgi:SAM-dependent methyltransferase
MVDIQRIAAGLELGKDGIWYSKDTENISYPPEGSESCFAIEENSFWFRHRNNCIASVVKSYPPVNNGTIFDIGGGNGFVSLCLANSGCDVALVEPRIAGAVNAKKRGITHVICATTNTAHFKQNSLPAVGLFDVVEHIENDLMFLKSVRGLMRKDGRLYLTVPSYSWLWSAEDVSAGHYRRYALGDLRNVLKAAGFHIEFSSYIFRFLPVPIFFLRVLPYRFGVANTERTSQNNLRDHAVKGGNRARVIDSVLTCEIDNLNKRKSMLFGGSCLIVANCA